MSATGGLSDGDGGKNEELEWPMDRIRSTFVNFFVEKHEHTFWPSSSCVPHDDPTLLFANAGMNQYKPLFLGTCDPSLEMSRLKRAVNSQKCIRAGGKHNDLDDVGKDVYHHTFFEMLGNWSFGDYFKEEAIHMAWTCLTEEFGLDESRLYATYFAGDDVDGSPVDEEAREIWLRYLPASRVLPFDRKDNFWEMGATGPCGPCVEIHYDRIGNRDASALVNADLPDVIEIWNNVFIQYNRETDGSLRKLPAQHVDTGMGFERLASILQGVDSNYDTDIFKPLFAAIQELTGARPYAGKVDPIEDVGRVDMAYRVVADHVRTLSFAVADGAVPSNEGRGYVLRRILRRAVRYGRQNLGAELGFFAKLVPSLIDLMGGTYPELVTNRDLIIATISDEETAFSKTLDKGLLSFTEFADKQQAEGGEAGKVFSGADAHKLYTEQGFPVDLTVLMAEERGMTLDMEGFHRRMEEERKLSENARLQKMYDGAADGRDLTLQAEQTFALANGFGSSDAVPPTNDEAKYIWNVDLSDGCVVETAFVGRNDASTEGGLGFADVVDAEKDSGMVGLILNKTNFYAESGGQVNDVGKLVSGDAVMEIATVQVYGAYVLHVGRVVKGTFCKGDAITCSVDYDYRRRVAANHTMTHVLNLALRHVLVLNNKDADKIVGDVSIDQKGSLVDAQKLRFDFSWPAGPLTDAQLKAVESQCAEAIATSDWEVKVATRPTTTARAINTLRAVFGETYPDPVRVVALLPPSTGIDDLLAQPSSEKWMEYSVEFCGGTHLETVAACGAFALLSEENVAKGVRRIVAVTGDAAVKARDEADAFGAKVVAVEEMSSSGNMAGVEQDLKVLKEDLKNLGISAIRKVEFKGRLEMLTKAVMAYNKTRQKEQAAAAVDTACATLTTTTTPPTAVCRHDFGINGKDAKAVAAAFAKRHPDAALFLVTADEDADRFLVFATAPKNTMDCKAWVTAATEGTGAKGGGKKDSAQFNVAGLGHVDTVLEKAAAFLR